MDTVIEKMDSKPAPAEGIDTEMSELHGEQLEASERNGKEPVGTGVKMEMEAELDNFLDDLLENTDAISQAVGGLNEVTDFSIESSTNHKTLSEGLEDRPVRIKAEPTASLTLETAAPSTVTVKLETPAASTSTLAPSTAASTPAIRVKAEYTQMEFENTALGDTSGSVPSESFFNEIFFNEILELEDNILRHNANVPKPTIRVKTDLTAVSVKSEDVDTQPVLPEDFFDDLLVDEAAHRAGEMEINVLKLKEESVRSELQSLDEYERRKKQKKRKKKSKKRSRSHSAERSAHKRVAFDMDSFQNDISGKDFVETITGANRSALGDGLKTIILNKVASVPIIPMDDDIGELLTPSGKQKRSFDRATKTLKELKREEQSLTQFPSPFIYAKTLRIDPNATAREKYRSPMHKRGMQHNFNSLETKIDYSFWGLQALVPSVAAAVRTIGADLDIVYDMLKTLKLPENINAANSGAVMEVDGESEEEASCSLYRNVRTQTEKGPTHDIGLMAKPFCFSQETQTSESSGSMKQMARGNETLQRMFESLNPNQFQALADFTELLLTNAHEPMDLIYAHQRLVDIFNSAEVPIDAAPQQRKHRLADPRITAQRPPHPLPETSADRYTRSSTYDYVPPPPPSLTPQHPMSGALRHAMPTAQHHVMPGASRHALLAAQRHAMPTAQHHTVPGMQQSRVLPPRPILVPNSFYASHPHPQIQAVHNSNMLPNPASQNNTYYQRRQ